MQHASAYLGKSAVRREGGGSVVSLAPNLARDPVAFDAGIRHPLRFREAISALHEVVVSDLRFTKRDKTAYRAWKKAEAERKAALFREVQRRSREEILAAAGAVPAELEAAHKAAVKKYWSARSQYDSYLRRNQPRLWWILDPVITVAEDVVFFECFSQDLSSYACLTIDRATGFDEAPGARPGTTNVDYSFDLYEHFQGLRTYRPARLRIDPQGFEVATGARADYREEKVDLPPAWLRGFMQLQAAMTLPARRVELGREAVYSLLAFLRRRREKRGPRALRFELLPGEAPAVVLEPWDKRVVSHGSRYDGPPGAPVRVWGRRRLAALARVLPLAQRVTVHLLGTGLPSFWVVDMGEMRLTLGLSGWTTNDWSAGGALEAFTPPVAPDEVLVERVAKHLRVARAADLTAVRVEAGCSPGEAVAALGRLAHSGQLIHDLGAGVFRWRSILPRALGEAELGGPDPQRQIAEKFLSRGLAKITDDEPAPRGGRIIAGRVGRYEAEVVLDVDGVIRRGHCRCDHHRKSGLRRGPCGHLQGLRELALLGPRGKGEGLDGWLDRLRAWGGSDG